MSLYRSIVRQSFIIAWKHKYLWFFGLFATLLASNFEIELINRFTNRQGMGLYDWERWRQTGVFSPQAWSNFVAGLQADTWSFISIFVILIVLVVLVLALLWLSVVSQGGLINNVSKALADGSKLPTKIERRHDTVTGFREGKKYFWSIFSIHVLVRLAVYVLALITIVPLTLLPNPGVAMSFVYFFFFVFLLALALVLAFITKYAVAYVVLKNYSFGKSIIAAVKLFKNNWLISLEMTIILFAISIIGSLSLILAVMIMAIPIAFLYVLSLIFGSFPIFAAVLILGVIVSVGIIMIGGAILTVIQTTSWVSLFTQLTSGKAPQSKLQRVFNNE